MKKGRRPSEILVLFTGIAKHHPRRQVIRLKSTSHTGHETFRILVLAFEIGGFDQREQELKALCYIIFRESVVAHPRISKIDLQTLAEKV